MSTLKNKIITLIVEELELELTREFRKAARAADRIITLFARPDVAVATVDLTGLDEVKAMANRVKRLQRLVHAYDGLTYTDPGNIISAHDDVEKQSEYELARQDCEENGDLEDEG